MSTKKDKGEGPKKRQTGQHSTIYSDTHSSNDLREKPSGVEARPKKEGGQLRSGRGKAEPPLEGCRSQENLKVKKQSHNGLKWGKDLFS